MPSWSTAPAWSAGQTSGVSAGLQKLSDDLNVLGGAWTTDARSAATIWSGTVGSGGAITSLYRQVGPTGASGGELKWEVTITLGTGFAIGTGLTAPVTMASGSAALEGHGHIFDTSAVQWYDLSVVPSSTTALLLRTNPATAGNQLSPISSTVPVTFAAGDQIAVVVSYRIA